ncbi:hypothetical protein QBC40DRAFT_275772 [Triangularia verruculosa]|uniref:Uncharacterized protein n=1 Tax=Triangularia verruculosa TaxID=2587418 RepID=A0AAN6XM33_9PEZI|nr:hypothetical protein QBC40DRAFT_275772 [Triangularia verruculosa]
MDEGAPTPVLPSGSGLPVVPDSEAQPTSPSLAATHAPSTVSGNPLANPLPSISTFAAGTASPQIQQPRSVLPAS